MKGNISLTLATDKTTYQVTEPIAMSLVVLNLAEQPEKITFSSSKEFDFQLISGEQTIWKWSAGKMFAQSLRTKLLDPGKPFVYLTIYNPAISRPTLPEGRYQLTGTWTTLGQIYSSAPVAIEIHK